MEIIKRIFYFYRDGFAGMTIGKSLWLLIIIKVAILFLVLKLFFFPNHIKDESANNGLAPQDVVRQEMLDRSPN
ncbi:MAG: DUF4492 domain-containing protein [Muribaculaceae bacterium]|nr:DUF4492 domain-containing protein [Muribaculaceae bacterium]